MLPNPWHRGHAPNGLLNEKSFGSGSSYRMPHFLHSKASLNRNRFSWRRRSVSGGPFDDFENDFAVVFAKTDLDRIDQPLPNVGSNLETIDQHVCGLAEIHVQQRFRTGVIESLAILINPAESAALEIGQKCGELFVAVDSAAADRERRNAFRAAIASQHRRSDRRCPSERRCRTSGKPSTPTRAKSSRR